jgi:hypothetical protein
MLLMGFRPEHYATLFQTYHGRETAEGAMTLRGEMTSSMTNLEACTDEELEQKLARVLVYASGEVLNDAELQEFYQLYEEIQRRALAVSAA